MSANILSQFHIKSIVESAFSCTHKKPYAYGGSMGKEVLVALHFEASEYPEFFNESALHQIKEAFSLLNNDRIVALKELLITELSTQNNNAVDFRYSEKNELVIDHTSPFVVLKIKELYSALQSYDFQVNGLPQWKKTFAYRFCVGLMAELLPYSTPIESEHDIGCNFKYIPNKTAEICLEYVERSVLNIEYVPKHLKTKELCDLVLARNPSLFKFIPKEFLD